MPDRRHQPRPSSAQWHTGLLASLRAGVESGGTGPEAPADRSIKLPAVADDGRGPGWYCVIGLLDEDFERLEDAVLVTGPAERRYPVLDVRAEHGSVFVRVQPAAPESGLVVFDRGDPVARNRDLLRGLDSPAAAKAVQPFARGVLDRLPAAEAELTPHVRAVRAARVAGIQIVWGAPATGKTAVVADALTAALEAGQRVLVVSPDPAAVDDALQRLLSQHAPRPGQIVRVGTPWLADLADHPDVSLDILVRARQRELSTRIDEQHEQVLGLRRAPERLALREARQRLAGFDSDEHRARIERLQNADRLERLTASSAETERLRTTRADELAAVDADLRERAGRAQQARVDQTVAAVEEARGALESEGRSPGRWARRRRLATALRDAERDASTQQERLASLQNGSLDPADVLVTDSVSDRASDAEALSIRRTSRDQLAATDAASAQQQTERQRLAALPVPEPDDAEISERALAAGLPELAASLPQLEQAAREADVALERAGEALQTLHDRARAEAPAVQAAVLDRATVVATTLSRLIASRALVRRRYDLVILDEASTAPLPEVVFAAAQAGRSCLLLGDYLQQGPQIAGGHRDDHFFDHDVFEHFGLTSARAAQHNPGCVLLDSPRRFGRKIVGYLNAIAYQGVLVPPADLETQLIWIDVDGLPSAQTRITGGPGIGEPRSWPAGAEVAAALATQHGARGESVGIITPYTAQAELIRAAIPASSKDVWVGTAAGVSGRTFDVVVFDTVEDGQGWIARARRDATGPDADWCRDGLRVIDVALTRGRDTVYLIASGRALRGDRGTPMGELVQLCASGEVPRVTARRVLESGTGHSATGDSATGDSATGDSADGDVGVEQDGDRAVVDQ